MMILLSHIQSPQRETEKIVVAKCSQSKPVKYHSAVLRVGRKKHELVLVKTSRFRLKIPVLDATISDGDGATSREKYPVLIATQNGWKYPQVSFCLETCGDKTQPKHDLQQLKPEQESQNKIVKLQHIGSILFWRLGCPPSTFTRFGFKIPVLGATISDGEGATSCEKYSQVPQISTAVSPIWKLPAVFVVIKSGVPKHDLFPTETKT